MVDFKKFVKKKQEVNIRDLKALFESLDRHASHTDLRPTQDQSLAVLTGRRNDHDLVLKISTGSGKTAVALLYLLSHMEEREVPVVYLCPTIQLVKQVKEEASKLGIKAIIYPGGETFPSVEGTVGKAIIICTYDKLFNAKSTFDRRDVHLRPCAIVCDDAHAGIEEIKDAFTLRILADSEIHSKLLELFRQPCEKYDFGKWQGIINRDPYIYLEIPYWIWNSLHEEIQKILSPHAEDDNFIFVWPFLRDLLKRCRCIISIDGIEIVPDVLPVHLVEAFSEAPHRLFMSATLADDSILIRELGCELSAASKPILPENDRGMGERMVLAPSLVKKDLNRIWLMNKCKELSNKFRVIVLSPSEWAAKEWESEGATVVIGNDVAPTIDALKDGSSELRFIVFVQRYDGIDLPDDACRILVIDGIPYGEGIADKYDSSVTAMPGGMRNRLIYRIEQGMGRAVRSHVDYAVVILAGPEIAHFIAKKEVLAAMNVDTRAQLELALELSKMALEDGDEPDVVLVNMLMQCLKRDKGWKQFYEEYMSESRKEAIKSTDEQKLSLANAEREAFESAMNNNYKEAAEILRHAVDSSSLNDRAKGVYLQKMASYIYEVNEGRALEVQQSAHEKNNSMFCPPSIIRRPIAPGKFDVQSKIISWFSEFQNPNGAIAALEELRAKLSYNVSSETIEEAIKELAKLLGAEGSRPEKDFGEGPDDLWLWPSISLVIEAKNQNEETLHKKDAGQLVLSLEWFANSFPTYDPALPVVIAKVFISDPKSSFPKNTRVITPSKMSKLLDDLERFYNELINEPPLLVNPSKVAELQKTTGISPDKFINRYTVPLKELPKK